MTDDSGKICFVIAPIGEVGSDTRKRSDQFLHHIIRPVAEAKGYSAIRADEISEPGIITSQVIQHIVDDSLVVADLSERNPNVFYELAIRHAIRKPFIQIINKGETIPFDVAATRTIIVDHHDLDNVEVAKKELERQISTLESDATKLETPISVSLDLQNLRRSENPGERSLADVLSELSGIRAALSEFEERIEVNASGLMNRRSIRQLEERLVSTIHEAMRFVEPSRRRRSAHPSSIGSVVHFVTSELGNVLALPILLSLIREDAPWTYELGMEGYRQITTGNKTQGRETIRALLRLIDFTEGITGVRSELDMVLIELKLILIKTLDQGFDK